MICLCIYINKVLNEAHWFGLYDAEGHLVGLVQLMSAVHPVLKARLLPDGVVCAKLWRDHPQHWGAWFREDERLEYRPSRKQERDRGRPLSIPRHANVRTKCCGGETTSSSAARTKYDRRHKQLFGADFSFAWVYRKLYLRDKEKMRRERQKGGHLCPLNNYWPSKLQFRHLFSGAVTYV